MMRKLLIMLAVLLASGNAQAWVMEAEGYGDTPEQAKIAAYATLAGQIRSEIKSETSISTKVDDQLVSKKSSLAQSQKSELLLQGVSYLPAGKFQKGYKTVARLDANGLKQTLSYYETQTEFDPFGINFARARELKELLLMWRALSSFAPGAGVSANAGLLEQRLLWVNARLEGGLLRVHSSASGASLRVDGQIQPLDSALVVSEGNHQVTLSAPQYRTLDKVIYIGKGSAVSLSEDLLPANREKQLVLVISEGLSDYLPRADIEGAMGEVGWKPVSTGRLRLGVEGAVTVRQSGNYVRYTFDFNIAVHDGDHRLKSVSFQKTVTLAASTDRQQLKRKLLPELRKALTLLANNVVWPDEQG